MLKGKRFFKSSILVTVAFFLAVSLAPCRALAIGISPPVVTVDSILRDTTITKTVHILRAPENVGDVYISVSTQGEFAHYIEGESEIIIPSGEDSVDYSFDINPKNAASGDYQIRIVFLLASPEQANVQGSNNSITASSNVVTGVNAIVNISVSGDEVVTYDLLGVGINETEIGAPLILYYSYNNTGNVEWKPDEIHVTFVDTQDQSNTTTEIISGDQISLTKPGEEGKTVELELTSQLVEASYQGQVTFYDDGEQIGSFTTQTFHVYPKGTLAQSGELVAFESNKTLYEIGELILLETILENTGELPINGVLYFEVYKDGSLIDLVRAKEVMVSRGGQTKMSNVLDQTEAGEYSVTAYVEYANKKTNELSTNISIKTTYEFLSLVNSIGGLVVLAVLIFVVAFLFKKRKKKQGAGVTTQLSTPHEEIVESYKEEENKAKIKEQGTETTTLLSNSEDEKNQNSPEDTL